MAPLQSVISNVGALFDSEEVKDALDGAPKSVAMSIAAIESAGNAFGRGWQPADSTLVAITNRFERTKYKEITSRAAPDLMSAWLDDPELSLAATSWGVGQVMGFNHYSVGFKKATDMVTAFRSPLQQIIAMCALVARIYTSVGRTFDAPRIARLYNGPAAPDIYIRQLAIYHSTLQQGGVV